MKGIIYKDYLLTLTPKHFISIFADLLVTVPIVFFFQNMYGLALSCLLLLPMCGTTLLQVSMEQDELSDFDKIQLTFPLTKKEIILSKYLGGLSFMGIFAILSLGLSMYFYGVLQVADLVTCLQIWAGGLVAGITFLGISYVGFFLLGNKKGTIIYFILAVIATIVYIISYFSFDAMSIFQINYNLLIAIGLVVAALVLFASYCISLKIYTKKHS